MNKNKKRVFKFINEEGEPILPEEADISMDKYEEY
jgi:hypothetical protein